MIPLFVPAWVTRTAVRPRHLGLLQASQRCFSLGQGQQQQQQQKHKVEISPNNHGTQALTSLVESNTHPKLVHQLKESNLTTPTPIQAHAIPLLQKGLDVMASAQTGSGKSIMFALPLLQHLLTNTRTPCTPSRSGNRAAAPQAIILNPTRELAVQTQQLLQELAPSLNVALATGGAPTAVQRKALLNNHQPIDIVVGTPGRLQQFLDERTTLQLKQCHYVVIDEADRLLDMGFEPQLQQIARSLPSNLTTAPKETQRQTVLCSATFPLDVQRLGSLFLKPNYYFVATGKVGSLSPTIQQSFVWAGDWNHKPSGKQQQQRYRNPRHDYVLKELQSYLESHKNDKKHLPPRAIVFLNTKEEAEQLGTYLMRNFKGTARVRTVTGDKTQSKRTQYIQEFRDGNVAILVATDVAARGLDVPNVGLVVQAETPSSVDTFVHRTGRTGRAGAFGAAVTLMDSRSMGISMALVDILYNAKQQQQELREQHEREANDIEHHYNKVAIDIPAWLQGMSHVMRAKQMEEDELIAAGGGGAEKQQKTLGYVENGSDTRKKKSFIGQDFRSTENSVSWVAEQDTSYKIFDQEAYRTLDLGAGALPESILDNEDEDDSTMYTTTMSTDENSGDGIKIEDDVDLSHDGLPFQCPGMSSQLRTALKRLTGSSKLSINPNPELIQQLDKREKWEYIGMFPFDDISEYLFSNHQAHESSANSLPCVLMVAEKPSIAKAIAEALSGPQGARQRRGISRALPVYEFTSNKFEPAIHDPLNPNYGNEKESHVSCIVTSVVGHIFSLGFETELDEDGNRRRLEPKDYFSIPVVKQKEDSTVKLRVIDHLRALAAQCDHLVLWLDNDAEGENIGYETISVTRQAFEQKLEEERKLKREGPLTQRIHRAHFSAITGDALRKAFGNLGEPNPALSQSVDARQELDLRVGVAMTRLINARCIGMVRKQYSPSTRVVSYGPCQTPTLSFCVDRAREIQAFTPRKYWEISASAKFSKKYSMDMLWKPSDPLEASERQKLGYSRQNERKGNFVDNATFDERAAHEIVEKASSSDSFLSVTEVKRFTEKVKPPVGLNTVTLLSVGSKTMGMSPKQVMSVAEKLYSSGFISYPRTETTRYDPTGFDVRAILAQHSQNSEWGRAATHLLKTKYSKHGKPPQQGKDAGDHPPITALCSANRDMVGGGAAWRVYEFIVRNMLGSFGDELTYIKTVAELKLEGKHTSNVIALNSFFEVEQIQVEALGFARVCNWVLKDIGAQSPNIGSIASGGDLPLFKGMNLAIGKIQLKTRTTRPPRFLQEHELIELMDTNRVGTDASMATHVNNIMERGYVVLCDETGTEIRPHSVPHPGQPRLPRQIGRYLVPTPLGIGLMDLFDSSSHVERIDAKGNSPFLLARPSIRAQMEAECKQITLGKLDKETCMKKNLKWFEKRHQEMDIALTRDFLESTFRRTLQPLHTALGHWHHMRVFEPKIKRPIGTSSKMKGKGGKKKKYRQKNHVK
eukprot:CAMPEP_0172460258 /NCGR_PEP_ID=MMETSP1065-20121228/36187_1 /TAXON_ID=265537 /ORGANISM="Amphiprora paludosa, Strain CCMP125" /LENGTH=1488 /DNA_ID=CAMNT_0013215231 /DNA_START=259 /DNA_END=4725 /DNA_ORIENTATION=+